MITDKDVEKLKGTFATKEDLKQFATKEDLKNLKEETIKHFDVVTKDIKSFKEEIIRHFDVVAEDIINNSKLVLEQFSTNTEKLADHEEKIENLTTDVSILKTKMTAQEARAK